MTRALLTLGLLAGCPHDAPPVVSTDAEFGLFDQCAARQVDATARVINCRTIHASITERPRSPGSDEELVRSWLKAFLDASKAEVIVRGTEATLGGMKMPVATVSVPGPSSAPALRGFAHWVTTETGNVRLVTCLAAVQDPEGDARCRTMLDYLVMKGAPPGLPDDPDDGRPRLLGRRLDLPEACEVKGHGAVGSAVCPDGVIVLWWRLEERPTEESRAALFEQVLALNRSEAENGPAVEVSEVSCKVEGVPRSCQRLVSLPSGGPPLVQVLGFGDVHGVGVLVGCSWPGQPEAPPPACSAVLAL